jgi:hypothetical protein
MQCSSRKFVASQVYYGLRIANPLMTAEALTDQVVREADMLLRKLERKPKRKAKDNRQK